MGLRDHIAGKEKGKRFALPSGWSRRERRRTRSWGLASPGASGICGAYTLDAAY